MRSDDLAPLLTPRQAADLGFRQGRVLAWDPVTGTNTIEVAGQPFTDLPMLAVTAIALAPGDLVGLLRYKSTYLIIGRINTVNNQRGNYLVGGLLGLADTQFATWPSTTSASYAALLSGFLFRSGTRLLVYARSFVGPNTSGTFALNVDGVVRVESATFVGGAGGAIGNLELEFDWQGEAFGDALAVSLVARRTAGADKVAASFQGAWTI